MTVTETVSAPVDEDKPSKSRPRPRLDDAPQLSRNKRERGKEEKKHVTKSKERKPRQDAKQALKGEINESFENDPEDPPPRVKPAERATKMGVVKAAAKLKKIKETARRRSRALPSREPKPVLQMTIHRTDRLPLSIEALHPLVQVHLMDTETGDYILKKDRGKRVTSYYEDAEKWTFILPLMTRPADSRCAGPTIPLWEEVLIFNEEFDYIAKRPQTIIFFELVDFISSANAIQRYFYRGSGSGWVRIAWAFLRPLGANGHENFGSQRLRLQLFEPMRFSHHISRTSESDRGSQHLASGVDAGRRLMEWWASGPNRRKRYPATLYVTLRSINLTPEENMTPVLRSLYPNQMEAPNALSKRHPYLTSSMRSYREQALLASERMIRRSGRHLSARKHDEAFRLPNRLAVSLDLSWNGGQQHAFSVTAAGDSSNLGQNGVEQCSHHGVQDIRFSGDGKWLALAATGDCADAQCAKLNGASAVEGVQQICPVLVYKWPLGSQDEPWKCLRGHWRRVYSLAWAPATLSPTAEADDGLPGDHIWLLASASADGTARVWWLLDDELPPPQELLHDVTAVAERTPRRANTFTEQIGDSGLVCCVLGHPGFVYAVDFRPLDGTRSTRLRGVPRSDAEEEGVESDGSPRRRQARREHLLATGCVDGTVRLWSIKGRVARLVQELTGHRRLVNCVRFNPSGTLLYSGDGQGRLIFWEPVEDGQSSKPTSTSAGGRPTRRQPPREQWILSRDLVPADIDHRAITSIENHPSANRILVQARDSYLIMVDVQSGVVMAQFSGIINALEFIRSRVSPCGVFVFSGSEDGSLHVWNSETGENVKVYDQLAVSSPIASLDIHPTEHVFAVASVGQTVPLLIWLFDPKYEIDYQPSVKSAQDVGLREKQTPRDLEDILTTANEVRQYQKETREFRRILRKLDSVTQPRLRGPKDFGSEDHIPEGMVEMSADQEGMARFTFVPLSAQEPVTPRGERGKADGTEEESSSAMENNSALFRSRGGGTLVTALYDYTAQRSDELSLLRNDPIEVLFKDTSTWWAGHNLRTNEEGYFLSSYVSQENLQKPHSSRSLRRDETFVLQGQERNPRNRSSPFSRFTSAPDHHPASGSKLATWNPDEVGADQRAIPAESMELSVIKPKAETAAEETRKKSRPLLVCITKMGRRSVNTTKSGKYMNPTDQARKEARKKELKKNKKQRMAVRHAVLKAKDATQLLEEASMYDKQEYDPNVQASLNERVLQEKRKRLLDTFDRLVVLYRKEDPERAARLQAARTEYDKRRHEMMLFYEQVKLAERVKASEIPLPDLPPIQGLAAPEVPPALITTKSILKKPFVLPGPPPGLPPAGRKPPGPPPLPVPDLSDSDSEEPADTLRSRKIRFADGTAGDVPFSESQQIGMLARLQPSQIPLPPPMALPNFPGIVRPGFSATQPRIVMRNIGGAVLSAPPTLNPLRSGGDQATIAESSADADQLAATAAGGGGGGTTIEAKPQLKNLIGDATRFVPTAVKVKRTVKDAHGRLVYVGGGASSAAAAASAAKRSGNAPGSTYDRLSRSDATSNAANTGQSKDAAYEEFMREMAGLL
nr:unnamed protein product [Spirometra erinaceieuropaei]